jgi:hypothetical protein
MHAIKVDVLIEKDGELHLSNLPCRKGERVEAIVLFDGSTLAVEEQKREEARQRFLARARASKFRSSGPYPTREELYDRT